MVGVRAAEVVDELVTVGERSRMIAETARSAGLAPGVITELETTDQAIQLLSGRLQTGDVVLVKGSHGMRMDRIVTVLEASA